MKIQWQCFCYSDGWSCMQEIKPTCRKLHLYTKRVKSSQVRESQDDSWLFLNCNIISNEIVYTKKVDSCQVKAVQNQWIWRTQFFISHSRSIVGWTLQWILRFWYVLYKSVVSYVIQSIPCTGIEMSYIAALWRDIILQKWHAQVSQVNCLV